MIDGLFLLILLAWHFYRGCIRSSGLLLETRAGSNTHFTLITCFPIAITGHKEAEGHVVMARKTLRRIDETGRKGTGHKLASYLGRYGS